MATMAMPGGQGMGPVMVLSEYLLLDLHAVATAFALEVGLAENFKCLEGSRSVGG